MARISTDSWTTAGRSPASLASCQPRSLSGTSVHAVNRFSWFQVLSPWRSRTRVPGLEAQPEDPSASLAVAIDLGRRLDDVRELACVQACPADQDAVA